MEMSITCLTEMSNKSGIQINRSWVREGEALERSGSFVVGDVNTNLKDSIWLMYIPELLIFLRLNINKKTAIYYVFTTHKSKVNTQVKIE